MFLNASLNKPTKHPPASFYYSHVITRDLLSKKLADRNLHEPIPEHAM